MRVARTLRRIKVAICRRRPSVEVRDRDRVFRCLLTADHDHDHDVRQGSYFRSSPPCAGAHPVTHENVALSPQVSCAALSGLLPLDAGFPGLTPWALLLHPFGVFKVVQCLALRGFQGRAMLSPERAGQQSPGRKPWVENRRSQALKGRHRNTQVVRRRNRFYFRSKEHRGRREKSFKNEECAASSAPSALRLLSCGFSFGGLCGGLLQAT